MNVEAHTTESMNARVAEIIVFVEIDYAEDGRNGDESGRRVELIGGHKFIGAECQASDSWGASSG